MPFVRGFLPSRVAPPFGNGPWPADLDLKVSVPGLPTVSLDVTPMGLAGGMCLLARDVFECGAPRLPGGPTAHLPRPVVEHLLRRSVDSFGGPGVVDAWRSSTLTGGHSGARPGPARTAEAVRTVMASVDAGAPCPVGVVLEYSPWTWEVFNNHVELVHGYELVGSRLTLFVYDPNRPGSDGVTVTVDLSPTGGAGPVRTTGTDSPDRPGEIRGIFALPYRYVDPAPAYVMDDAGLGRP